MRHTSYFCSFLCVMLIIAAACCSAAPSNGVKQEITAAVSAVRPALVRIHVVSADYRQGREFKVESFGSGVIIDAAGHVVTNAHVTMDAEHIVCTLADKREVDAKVVGTDPLSDIAVIKLSPPDGKPFSFAAFGDSSKLSVGDRVFAMGCPFALSQSVTAGMVSNTEMIMPAYYSVDEFQLEGEDVGSMVRWIGHDALIRPGNSGGPLVTPDGKIVGINEISLGLAGAIPSNIARGVVEQIVEKGKVTRAWLGIEVQPILESAKVQKGVLVGGVLADSPSRKADIRSGDVILQVAGRNITARFDEEIPIFNQQVAALPVGKPVDLVVLRDGKQITLSVTPAARQKARDRQHELKSWGICGSNITYLVQREMKLSSQDGVMVSGVLPSGPAGLAKPSLREEDVIVSVGKDQVKDVAHLRELTEKITEGKKDPVPVLVSVIRKQERIATVVKVGKREPAKPSSEISKAWLPIATQVLTNDLAEAYGVPGTSGVRVTQVYPDSSASKAGLKIDDLIVKLDEESIPADQIGDEEVLASMIRQYEIGADVKLGVIRDGKPMDLTVKLESSPKPTRDYPKYEDENFEFTVRDIAFSDRADGSVARTQAGVLVEGVVEGSWAALGDLNSGDVITAINGGPIANLDDVKRAMSDIAKKKPKRVVFSVRRGIHTKFLEFEPAWPEQP